MRRRLRILPAASRDLEEQALYIAQRNGIERALEFYEAADLTFALATRHPFAGAVRNFRHPLLHGVRMLRLRRFNKHLVFYQVVPGEIQIVRVLHGARDIDNLYDD